MDRRGFITGSAAALLAGSLGLGSCGRTRDASNHSGMADEPLRILILGGTGFLGPHQVEAARRRGHQLTLFNRGRSNPGLFPGIETLIGDRNGDLASLEGGQWDAVIDNSGFEPDQMRLSTDILRNSTEQYLFVSTQSVYADRSIVDQDETGPVGRPGTPEGEWSGYGPLKALCERTLQAAMPGRSTVVRPAVIVGPGDESDRFTYWVQRVNRGGLVLGPGLPDDPTQFIDARDLAEWMIHLLETRTVGTFNATGPKEPLTVGRMLEVMRTVAGSDCQFIWTNYDFLASQGVRPFSDLPMWMVPEGRTEGFMRMSATRAQTAGLTYRELAETVRDTLEWWTPQPGQGGAALRAGLSLEREAEIISAWRSLNPGSRPTDPVSE
jgi:2'-hydroxyisoflavone reductase